MKLLFAMMAVAAVMLAPLSPAQAETAVVGKAAPDFTGTDTNGKTVKLSDFKGKTVVLEWSNPECPYVMKHYGAGNMQALQAAAVKDGVIWLTVASSAPEKEGYMTGDEANAYMTEQKSAPTARILDGSGEIGKLYGAKTTPHMFVIDKAGTLVYAGAIDDNDSFSPETIKGAKNYITAALQNLKDGKPVETSSTKPYGCGVKYKN